MTKEWPPKTASDWPDSTDFRALCVELLLVIEEHCNPHEYVLADVVDLLSRARAALNASLITRPTDADIAALLRELQSELNRCYPYAPYAHKPTKSVGLCKRARAMAEQLEPTQEKS